MSSSKSRNTREISDIFHFAASAGTTFSHGINWASEASPTLGCSIEISRDIYIYIYVHVSVVVQKA